MRKLILALVISMLSSISFALDSKEAAKILNQSVVPIQMQNSDKVCTAFKVGHKTYITAGHCFISDTLKVGEYIGAIRSVELGVHKKKFNRRSVDWAIITTFNDNDDIKPLGLDCYGDVEVGEAVSYMGYPGVLEKAYGEGVVATKERINNSGNDADFVISPVAAAPGGSGSPIISRETGLVVGILTEGIHHSRVGFFAIGVEDIKNTIICDRLKAEYEEAMKDVTEYQ